MLRENPSRDFFHPCGAKSIGEVLSRLPGELTEDLRQVFRAKPTERTIRHQRPWCDRWSREGDRWVLTWNRPEVRRYYLYHLLLHELGHLNQPWTDRGRKAEDFALDQARRLGELG